MAKRRERFDWEEFWDSFPWWGIIIGIIVIGSFITGIIESKNPRPEEPKHKAIVIELPELRHDNHKVKFIDDGIVDVRYLEKGYSVGDTILIEK